jgi:hypothetical protein
VERRSVSLLPAKRLWYTHLVTWKKFKRHRNSVGSSTYRLVILLNIPLLIAWIFRRKGSGLGNTQSPCNKNSQRGWTTSPHQAFPIVGRYQRLGVSLSNGYARPTSPLPKIRGLTTLLRNITVNKSIPILEVQPKTPVN